MVGRTTSVLQKESILHSFIFNYRRFWQVQYVFHFRYNINGFEHESNGLLSCSKLIEGAYEIQIHIRLIE